MSTNPKDSAASNSYDGSGSGRTMAFIIAAVGCLAVTGILHWMSRPQQIEEYGKVGQQFYPDFVDPNERDFAVRFDD